MLRDAKVRTASLRPWDCQKERRFPGSLAPHSAFELMVDPDNLPFDGGQLGTPGINARHSALREDPLWTGIFHKVSSRPDGHAACGVALGELRPVSCECQMCGNIRE